MPRPMSPAMLTAIQSSLIRPALFVAAQFADGWLYVWSGVGAVTWNGHTWTGVGTAGTASVIEEGTNVSARGITLTLSGINSTMLAEALQNTRTGNPVMVYLGIFDDSQALIPTPITSWAGRMDQPTIEVGAETSTISIACESKLLDMNVAVDRRYTMEDAQMDAPGDLGFMFTAGIQNATIYWGATPNSANNM